MQIAKCKMMGREADVWGKKVGPFNYSGGPDTLWDKNIPRGTLRSAPTNFVAKSPLPPLQKGGCRVVLLVKGELKGDSPSPGCRRPLPSREGATSPLMGEGRVRVAIL
ncbi:hypothetical protein CEE36_00440 [candidate division TA06 bacterium B3_TA06]|uniref:Uncharacterized protein n=1 Tax=candidate division TA06 bacterium B3_TA06 TaxID=2012487 RepID=A0A532VAL4_UNCT6|nr:MAG: hypothetical protein CEE36_00440 [candidate division TA06 bacterium B3_TA06]